MSTYHVPEFTDDMMTGKLKPAIGALIAYYYELPGNELGGNLHVILDDDNGWQVGCLHDRYDREKTDSRGITYDNTSGFDARDAWE